MRINLQLFGGGGGSSGGTYRVSKMPGSESGIPNSKYVQYKNGKKFQERWYNKDGRAQKDRDYTNHGNAKRHPKVPHNHDWGMENGQGIRSGINMKKCYLCGSDIEIKKYHYNQCKKCKWIDDERAIKNFNEVIYPNITSFYNAKNLFQQDKELKPTFAELLMIIEGNFEVTFRYKNKKYGISMFDGYEIYEWNKEEGYQTYSTIEEFSLKAKIDNMLLKNIWKDIKQFKYDC